MDKPSGYPGFDLAVNSKWARVVHAATILGYGLIAWLVFHDAGQAIAFGVAGIAVFWRWTIPSFRAPRELDEPVETPDDIRMNAGGRPWM